MTRLQHVTKRVAARHEGGHTPLSRTSIADQDNTKSVSAWSKHPGFRNHLISLPLEQQHANVTLFPEGSFNKQLRAEIRTSFLTIWQRYSQNTTKINLMFF